MNLMGEYAAANHACIHRAIARNLGAEVLADIENHHNFAWRERHVIDGKEEDLVVHRKGATPAAAGVLGIIPGSMAAPGFVVRGRGHAESLKSASHGAGRIMSRTQARRSFAWGNVKRELAAKGITVLSAGLDEVPGVYKDIHAVMAQQKDLVEVLARFDPKLVKMAPEGERAED
jgi:tRNA-splicing ligase RtcB